MGSRKVETRRALAALFALLWSFTLAAGPVRAAEIVSAVTRHEDGTYRSRIVARLGVSPGSVYELLRDPGAYAGLNRGLLESRPLETREDGRLRTLFLHRACIFIFCKTARYVMDFDFGRDGTAIDADLVPEKSDFSHGRVRWRLAPSETGTTVTMFSEFTPRFWIPPLIGPYLIGRKLRAETIETVETMEALLLDGRRRTETGKGGNDAFP